MSKYNISLIKKKESLIEEKRLEIKDKKNEKAKIHSRMETLGNTYEYLASPACAISIALVALLSGPTIYVLPTLTAVAAVSITSYKYSLRKKLDKLNKEISTLKKERQQAYDEREEAYENIFNTLQEKGLDVKDYYHQIVNISKECDDLTDKMVPYKEKKKKLEKIRNIISRTFSYVLVPAGAIGLPLICSFVDVGTMGEVAMIGASSAVLFGCAMADEKLTEKVESLEDVIKDIKSDRTVKYIGRDIKLNEALNYLNSIENDSIDFLRCRSINKKEEKKEKVAKR